MLATLLHHAGVDFMMIGCNGASGPLRVPPLFWWEGPDGSRVLMRYSPNYGTQLEPDPGWPYRTWLAVLHTGDNHGPPQPEEVKRLLARAAREYPGVRSGRAESDFYDAIVREAPDLPNPARRCSGHLDSWTIIGSRRRAPGAPHTAVYHRNRGAEHSASGVGSADG